MKTKIKYIIVASLMVSGLFISNSCSDLFNNPMKDKDTGDDITLLLLDPNFFDAKFSFEFVDYETGETLEGQDIGFMLIGDRASDLVTIGGEIEESYVVEGGYLDLYLDPNKDISELNPISLSGYAWNENYASLPITIETTQLGNHTYQVQMVNISQKSASVYQGTEPYEISFTNGEPSKRQITYFENEFTFHTMFYNQATGGTPSSPCSNPIICSLLRCCSSTVTTPITMSVIQLPDENLYTNCGFVDYISSFLHSSSITSSTSYSLYKGKLAYSVSKVTGLEKCDDGEGLTISVKEVNSSAGSGRFTYHIKFANNTEKTGWFDCNFEEFNSILIENIYYPSSNPAVTVSVEGNLQYSVSPSEISLSNPCGATATFTATPITGLTKFVITGKYYCLDNPIIAIAPSSTFAFRYRKTGATGNWTYFSMNEGIATLWLEKGSRYDFAINTDGKWESYSIPTSKADITSFLATVDQTKFEIKSSNLKITEESTQTSIDIKVGLRESICSSLQIN